MEPNDKVIPQKIVVHNTKVETLMITANHRIPSLLMAHLLLHVITMEHLRVILEELEQVERSDLPHILKAVMVKMVVRFPDGLEQIQSCLMDVIQAGLEMQAELKKQKEKNRQYH